MGQLPSQCSQFASSQKALWFHIFWINGCNTSRCSSWDRQFIYLTGRSLWDGVTPAVCDAPPKSILFFFFFYSPHFTSCVLRWLKAEHMAGDVWEKCTYMSQGLLCFLLLYFSCAVLCVHNPLGLLVTHSFTVALFYTVFSGNIYSFSWSLCIFSCYITIFKLDLQYRSALK